MAAWRHSFDKDQITLNQMFKEQSLKARDRLMFAQIGSQICNNQPQFSFPDYNFVHPLAQPNHFQNNDISNKSSNLRQFRIEEHPRKIREKQIHARIDWKKYHGDSDMKRELSESTNNHTSKEKKPYNSSSEFDNICSKDHPKELLKEDREQKMSPKKFYQNNENYLSYSPESADMTRENQEKLANAPPEITKEINEQRISFNKYVNQEKDQNLNYCQRKNSGFPNAFGSNLVSNTQISTHHIYQPTPHPPKDKNPNFEPENDQVNHFVSQTPRNKRIIKRIYSNNNAESITLNDFRVNYSKIDPDLAHKERMLKCLQYRQDLLDQIEEKKRRKAEEEARKKFEDQMEEERIQREIAKMAQGHNKFNQNRITRSISKGNRFTPQNNFSGKSKSPERPLFLKEDSSNNEFTRPFEIKTYSKKNSWLSSEELASLNEAWRNHNLYINQQIVEIQKTLLDINKQKAKAQQEINKIKYKLKMHQIKEKIKSEMTQEIDREIHLPKLFNPQISLRVPFESFTAFSESKGNETEEELKGRESYSNLLPTPVKIFSNKFY